MCICECACGYEWMRSQVCHAGSATGMWKSEDNTGVSLPVQLCLIQVSFCYFFVFTSISGLWFLMICLCLTTSSPQEHWYYRCEQYYTKFLGGLGDWNSGPHIQVLWAIPHVVIMSFVAVFLSSKHFRSLSETYAKFNNIRCSELHHWTEITMSIWPLQWCRPGAAKVSVKSFTSTTQLQRPCWLPWSPSLIL